MQRMIFPSSIPALLAVMAGLGLAGGTQVAAQGTYVRGFERATTFATEFNGMWSLSNGVANGLPDLIFVKTRNTPNDRVEVHVAPGSTQYQTRGLEIATTFANEHDGVWGLVNNSPGTGSLPDLYFIKTRNTPNGMVEVHIASGASRYQARTLEVATTFASEPNGTWGVVANPAGAFPDLYFIKTANTPSGNVEVHTASGASRYQTRSLETVTDFANETGGAWSLIPNLPRTAVPGLAFIKVANTPDGHVEVHLAQFVRR